MNDQTKRLPSSPETQPKTDDCGNLDLRAAEELARKSARDILQQLGRTLDRKQSLKLGTAFRRELVPRRKPGRKRNATITAAHEDWKAGMRGFELYRKHISGFARLSRWKREAKIKRLNDAIRSRERRGRLECR